MNRPGGKLPITKLLQAWQRGDTNAGEVLMPVLYEELKKIAGGCLGQELAPPIFKTAELVHEAYFRLVDPKQATWQDRGHFYGIAAKIMRQLLIEHARKRKAQKRGGEEERTLPDHSRLLDSSRPPDLIELDEALNALEDVDPKKCALVELKYFAGLTNEEVGNVLDMSVSSVKREWTIAKTWLYKYLSEG